MAEPRDRYYTTAFSTWYIPDTYGSIVRRAKCNMVATPVLSRDGLGCLLFCKARPLASPGWTKARQGSNQLQSEPRTRNVCCATVVMLGRCGHPSKPFCQIVNECRNGTYVVHAEAIQVVFLPHIDRRVCPVLGRYIANHKIEPWWHFQPCLAHFPWRQVYHAKMFSKI